MLGSELEKRLMFRTHIRTPRRTRRLRKVDGWHTLATKPIDQPIDLAA